MTSGNAAFASFVVKNENMYLFKKQGLKILGADLLRNISEKIHE